MSIQYVFCTSDHVYQFNVDIDRVKTIVPPETEWEALECDQCDNCPLSPSAHGVCPAARDMRPLIDQFSQMKGANSVTVEVVTDQRTYLKETRWQEGLKSLVGLVLATSQCPILGALRSSAYFHLPFASPSEFVTRAASMYLLKQHFARQSGEVPDWEFVHLREFNTQLQGVNKALWQRLLKAEAGEVILTAMLDFFEMSSALSHGLELHLQKIRAYMI